MTAQRIKLKLEAGLEVVVTGRITTYPGQSKYQIVIETLEPAGLGALMALVEERKKKLAAEGLFDPARKQLLPFLPTVIGVITSPTGAVIRDILHRLADRFPRRVLVWPVKVQGDGSAEEVAAAIRGFNALAAHGRIPQPDLLIVARGGGSLEDLWSFNEEIVVRAAADSMIPLISAVGHETDVTLIDFAADVRAPTPTAAAEMAVPVRADLMVRIDGLARRSLACWQRSQEGRRTELRAAARALPSADALLAVPRQRLDAAAERLPRALRANAQIHRVRNSSALAGRMAPQRAAHQRGAPARAAWRLQPCASAPRCGSIATPTSIRVARARERVIALVRARRPRDRQHPRQSRGARGARRPAAGGVLLSRGAGPRLCAGARRRRQSGAPRGSHLSWPAHRRRVFRRPRAGADGNVGGLVRLRPAPPPAPPRRSRRRRYGSGEGQGNLFEE